MLIVWKLLFCCCYCCFQLHVQPAVHLKKFLEGWLTPWFSLNNQFDWIICEHVRLLINQVLLSQQMYAIMQKGLLKSSTGKHSCDARNVMSHFPETTNKLQLSFHRIYTGLFGKKCRLLNIITCIYLSKTGQPEYQIAEWLFLCVFLVFLG